MGILEISIQLIRCPNADMEIKFVNDTNLKFVKFSLVTNNYSYNDNYEIKKTTSWHNIFL